MRTLGLVLALAGCASQRPATEIFVVVDAEPSLRADATSVRLVVTGSIVGGATETALDRTITGTDLAWPLTLGVVPRANDAMRGLRIESTLTTSMGGLARASARTGYVPEETRVLSLVHEASCIGIACDADETCTAAACVSDAVDPRELPADAGP